MIVITKDNTPQEVLSMLSAITPDPAKAIYESITSTYEYKGTSTDYLLYDTLDMILSDKRGIVAASITIDTHEDESKNDEEKNAKNQGSSQTEKKDALSLEQSGSSNGSSSSSKETSTNSFKVTELAYFENRKFKGYLEDNDTIVYNLLQNKLKGNVLSIDKGDNLIAYGINDTKAKLNPKFENDNFVIDIDLKVSGNITECGKNIRENMNNNYNEYKSKIEDIIKGKIEDAIDNYKYKYNVDIVGFEDLIYKKMNSKYKEIGDEFKEKYFENIKVNVKVNAEIPLEGGDVVNGRNK